MVGGLALSQLLTLYTTPVVYLYLGRLQAWLQAKQTERPTEMESAESCSRVNKDRFKNSPEELYAGRGTP
jgi:hypothetical protein